MITSAWLENLLIFYYVDELYKEKFVSHQFVNALYASLESRIVKTMRYS